MSFEQAAIFPGVRIFRLAGPTGDGRHAYCNETGAYLGRGTALLERVADRYGRAHFVPRPQATFERLLLGGYGRKIDGARFAASLGAVARVLDRGDLALASIALVQAEIDPLPDEAAAERLVKADRAARAAEKIQRRARQLRAVAKAGFNPDESRVPQGQSGGGEWTAGGPTESSGSSTYSGNDGREQETGFVDTDAFGVSDLMNQPGDQEVTVVPYGSDLSHLDPATVQRAQAIYGETAGLTPILLDPNGNPYDPENWDADSEDALSTARAFVGIISDRNSDVNFSTPTDPNNAIQMQAWQSSVDAAIDGVNGAPLDSRISNFFIRQEGIGPQSPNWPGLTKYMSIGPFNNVGGGDVPRGNKTYIDFYGK